MTFRIAENEPGVNHPLVAVFLAIESSCDETAVAILRGEAGGRTEVLASVIASQIEQHREHGGVVPELASRSHSLCLSGLVEEALKSAGTPISEIDVFGATMGPGLASSLLVGSTAAKAMSCVSGKTFRGREPHGRPSTLSFHGQKRRSETRRANRFRRAYSADESQ